MSQASSFQARFFTSANDVGQSTWQVFFPREHCPFSCFEFIHALEQSHCASAQTGWQPYHLGLYDHEQLIALAIGYIKTHSYGEYVFDWAIAQAYDDHDFDYYPKWLCAVPFTPITGPRIAFAPDCDTARAMAAITHTLNQLCTAQTLSSWHINFCDNTLQQIIKAEALPLIHRNTVQFQWRNHHYADFDAFCQTLKSRKRKSIYKERAVLQQENLHVEVLSAEQIELKHIHTLVGFYQRTYLKRSGHLGYLTPAFFEALWQHMRCNLVIINAYKTDSDKPVAASLFIRSHDTLFGRYWGCEEHFDNLHFELCYYQGIEYCIEHHLAYFNGGAQGEHKIARGFTPLYTHSYHQFINSPFNEAIKDFAEREGEQLALYKQQCEALSPYKS